MEVGFKSDKGLRRANNEDACFVLLPDRVYVVCDGVGGGNSGEIASRTAVNEVANYVLEHPVDSLSGKYEIVNYLQDCLEKANRKIYNMACTYEENTGMATTSIVIHVSEGKAYISNIGDSRVYLYRGTQLVQLTEDHTYVNSLVKAGIISEEQALTDSRKNVITKALGAEATVEPDFFQVELEEGDLMVACTDGLYDELDDEEMKLVLSKKQTMSEMCAEFVLRANTNGGHDNITVVCLKVTEEDINE